jgi:hypothetical protein
VNALTRALWLLAPLLLSAQEIVLQPDPTGAPVIANAIRDAAPGATIRLRKGIYREYVSITKPLTLAGDEGAVIDPSQPLRPHWELAPSYGPGVYRAEVERKPSTLFIDGRVFAEVNSERKETSSDEGPWFWKTLLAKGPPRAGFRYIRGLWLYRRDEYAIFVHLENDADAAMHNWTAVWERTPAVTLRQSKGASLFGVTLAHAYVGAAILDGCVGCSVIRCMVGQWDKDGVMVRNGAEESLVEANDIFRDSYESLTPITVPASNGGYQISREWYEVWQIHKTAGIYDRVGISLTLSGAKNRIHANHIHDVFDGIDLG